MGETRREIVTNGSGPKNETLRITDADPDTNIEVTVSSLSKEFVTSGATDWQGGDPNSVTFPELVNRAFINPLLAQRPEQVLHPDGTAEHLRRTHYVALVQPPNKRAAFIIATPTREGTLHELRTQDQRLPRTNRPFTGILTAEMDAPVLGGLWGEGILPLLSTYTKCKEPEYRLFANYKVGIPGLGVISDSPFQGRVKLKYPAFMHGSFQEINPLSAIGHEVSSRLLAMVSKYLIQNRPVYVDKALLKRAGDNSSAVTERIVTFVDYLNIAFAEHLQGSQGMYPGTRMPRRMIRFASEQELLTYPLSYADVIFTSGNPPRDGGIILNASTLEGTDPKDGLSLMFNKVLYGNTPIKYLQGKIARGL